MTQPSDILSDILNNFTRLFAPAPPATVAPAHGADEWQPLIEETKDMVKNNFPDCLSHSILATE